MQRSPARSTSPSSFSKFEPRLLWIAFRRHWGWIIPLGLFLGTAAAFGVIYAFVPEYVATHVLEANRDYVLAEGIVQPSRDLARSEQQLLMHAIVLDPVLSDPKLRSAPSLSDPLEAERQIRKRLTIGNAGTENLLTVAYRDSDPVAAAAVCNAIVESYLKVRYQRDSQRLGDIEQWLSIPIENWKRQVANKRQELTEMTKEAQGYDPFKQVNVVESEESKLAFLRSTLAGLEAEEAVINARKQVLEQTTSSNDVFAYEPSPMELRSHVDSDSDVQKLRTQLSDVQAAIRSLDIRQAQSFHQARYNGLKEEETRLEEEVATAEDAAREEAIAFLRAEREKQLAASHKREMAALDLELVNLQTKRETFRKDYEEEKARIESIGGETAEIFFAREDYEQAAEILSQLNNRLALLQTERGRSGSVQTMAAAKPPAWPIEELPFKQIGLAALAGLLFPFGLSLLLEYRWKRLTDADSIEANNLVPVMGEIARIPGGAKNGRSHRLFEESVDALRANLLFQLEGVRTIVVASSMPAEGKSSVASQLAISLAKSTGETVLLVDADLRSPDQHELFGLSVEPGLTKLLSGRATLEDAIDKSLGDLVHLLPAGHLDANPHNLLTKRNVESLFEQLKEHYHYVVVDTAPILPAAESLSVTTAADATLLCAMRDVSREDHVRRTHRRLEAAGANVLGTVFSGVPSREYAYRYGDYRYANRALETNA